MLYSTYIYEDRDCVRALAIKVDDQILRGETEFELARELRALAKHWKARLELPCRQADASNAPYDPRFQTFILTERGDWVPVDHFLWGKKNEPDRIQLEFTAPWCYFHEGTRPMQQTRKTHQAFRLFASALLRRARKAQRSKSLSMS